MDPTNDLIDLIDPAAIEEPRELGVTVVAQLAAGADEAVRARGQAIHARQAGPLPEPVLRSLLVRVRRTRAACRDVLRTLEPGYLLSNKEAQVAWSERQRREGFLDAFRRRIIFIGADEVPRAWSHMGWIDDHPDQPCCFPRDRGLVSVAVGVPGAGKTVYSTLMGEASFAGDEPVASDVPPTAYVFFHMEDNDRLPQLLDGLRKNPTQRDLDLLMSRLGVKGRGLRRLRLALPRMLLTRELRRRLRPYQDLGLEVVTIEVHLGEIGQPGIEAALGAESGARYVARMLEAAQDQGQALTTAGMRTFIEEAEDLNATMKRAAYTRLRGLEDIEAPLDGPGIWRLFEPGVATVVYLGGPHMGRGKVSPILVSLLSGLMMPAAVHGEFQRVIAVDEVNLLEGDEPAWRMLVRGGRLARHRGWTLILMGQDLFCVPDEMFSTVGVAAVFRQSSPQVFEHLRQRIGGLRGYRFEEVARLGNAEAIIASLLSTDGREARRVKLRPPLCMHGGFTRGMV